MNYPYYRNKATQSFKSPVVLIENSTYLNLHPEIKSFILPFDIYKNTMIHKLYNSDMSYKDVMYNEEEIYQSEFNLMRVISMKEQIEESLKLDFEILLELLNSSDHVCQNYSSTVKSLMMLCFNNLVSKNYRKV